MYTLSTLIIAKLLHFVMVTATFKFMKLDKESHNIIIFENTSYPKFILNNGLNNESAHKQYS